MKIVQRWYHYTQSRQLARLKRKEQKILKALIKHKTKDTLYHDPNKKRESDGKQRKKSIDLKVKADPEPQRRRKL
jgi:mRNA-degrading endonuclease RelE of RelBE toxin-antitoxin system